MKFTRIRMRATLFNNVHSLVYDVVLWTRTAFPFWEVIYNYKYN